MKTKARKGSIVLMSLVVASALLLGGLTRAIAGPRVIKVPEDYPTIQDAVSFALPGDKIIVRPGEWYGAVVDKPVEIIGVRRAVIVDGPPYDLNPNIKQGFFIVPDGAGARISGFTFQVDLPVFGRDADEVIVENNVMNGSLQGVTCVRSSRWIIKYNEITELGDVPVGGIGIYIISDILSSPANDNLVAFNKISGDFPDPAAWFRVGIGLESAGGEVTGNKVIQNHISITGEGMSFEIGIGLGAWISEPAPETVLFGNKIGFNDLRGSNIGLLWGPLILGDCNTFSRNLGENRAYDGLPANEFRPIV